MKNQRKKFGVEEYKNEQKIKYLMILGESNQDNATLQQSD